MFAELLSGEETVPAGVRPSRPNRRLRRPSGAAANAVAALVPELPGCAVLRDRGASDADLAAIIRALARRGKEEDGCRLLFERMAVVEYGGRKRIKGPALTAAVRSLHGIPRPDDAAPTPKPDIGRISDPERLPTSRWGYRSNGTWWSSTTSTDRDGENGFNRVRNPVTIGKLDAWARKRFGHLYAAEPAEVGSSIPDQFRSLAAAASVQGDLLANLGEEDDASEPAADSPRNYRITRAERIGRGTPRQKAAANLAAIRVLATLEAEARHPTPAEQAVLARYSGWGALPNVFRDEAVEWDAERTELRALLSQVELASAEASTPNAHFTSVTVIDGIYGLLAHLGFRGGTILEAGAGVGHFIGCAPDAVAARSRWTAIESDRVTGRILARLYPQEDVRIARFENSRLAEERYDAVVGNVPFGGYTVHDPVHNPENDLRVHDYFLIRAVAALRPGGLLVAITSRGTMDKVSRKARERLHAAADLLGAIRLPNTAFEANAGTKVTADILVLRKRAAGEAPAGASWLDTAEVECQDGPVTINEYFASNPSMMLGEMRLIRGLRSPEEPTLAPHPGTDLSAALAAATRQLPDAVYVEPVTVPRQAAADELADLALGLREGKFTLVRSRLHQKVNGTLTPAKLNRPDTRRVAALTRLCVAVRHVLQTQNEDHPLADQDAARAELNRRYDAFVTQFGCVNREQRIETRRPDGKPGVAVRRPNLQAYAPIPTGRWWRHSRSTTLRPTLPRSPPSSRSGSSVPPSKSITSTTSSMGSWCASTAMHAWISR
jgi:hypothetical protein